MERSWTTAIGLPLAHPTPVNGQVSLPTNWRRWLRRIMGLEGEGRGGMAAHPKMSVEEARATLEQLRVVTQAAEPGVAAPTAWIRRLNAATRTVAPRDVQYRYRVGSVFGVTMGLLSRRVVALLSDFDGLMEDNPRLTQKAR